VRARYRRTGRLAVAGGALYQQALDRLVAQGLAYPCACSRSDIEAAWARQGVERGRHTELVYPGTCRQGLQGRAARSWRLNTQFIQQNDRHPGVERSSNAIQLRADTPSRDATGNPALIRWQDRRLGPREQEVTRDVGDFVLKRADGLWAYQLAVVVDDADQGITDVVRGEDLADNTPRQILLQRALGLPTPRYLHTPLVLGGNGEKLSKQNGAPALDVAQPLHALNAAAAVLGLEPRWRQRGRVARALGERMGPAGVGGLRLGAIPRRPRIGPPNAPAP
jgi:glutamyl-Q tRNA(Asp) synthetase